MRALLLGRLRAPHLAKRTNILITVERDKLARARALRGCAPLCGTLRAFATTLIGADRTMLRTARAKTTLLHTVP